MYSFPTKPCLIPASMCFFCLFMQVLIFTFLFYRLFWRIIWRWRHDLANGVRGIATLGSSRHVPTHNFHKILRTICIKWNAYIFLVFNSYSVIPIFLYCNYLWHPDGSNWSSSLYWKTEKWIVSEPKQNKMVFSCRILQISIILSFTNINRVFGQWVLFINYYKLWYYI